YIAQEGVNHAHIPDSPPAESERRQFLFGAAIGLPTLFVREDSGNQFLRRILGRTRKVRPSHKYPGYLRIRTQEFRRALLGILREDASDLAESLGLDIEPMLADLSLRLDFAEEWSVAGRLIRGILEKAEETSALDLDGRRFNLCAEAYYREDLRRRHMAEALHLLAEDFEALDRLGPNTSHAAGVLRLVVGDRGAGAFLAGIQQAVLDERVAIEDLRALMSVILISVYHDSAEAEARPNEPNERVEHPASVRRSA
ncbi:MAG TPA: hypothetical protein VN203_25910, partial [Candidatus Acidoferrum sp.]|nr:hypothetical protein [Candidatus Acidoferrum sp.]